MLKNKSEQRHSVGIVLCICGVSIGGLIKVALGVNFSWISTLIIIISTFALVDIKRAYMYSLIPKSLVPIYLYSVGTILLAFINGTPFTGSNVSILYQLVYLLQIILLLGVREEYDSEDFSRKAFWILGFSSLFAIILINVKDFGVGFGLLLSSTDETSAVSRATTAFIAYYSICASIVFKPRKIGESIARTVFILISCLVLIMSSRRSTLIALVIVLGFRLRNNSVFKNINVHKAVQKVLIFILLSAVVVILLRTNDLIVEAMDRAWNSTVNGFQTYLGIEDNDMSAAYRRARIESIPYEYFNDSSFLQIIFGRGYNTDWLDIPFMQAFWDLGLVGGIWFIFIQGIIPIRHIFRKPQNAAIEFAQYYSIFRIIQNFSNGTPYGTFFPIVLLYVFEMAVNTSGQKKEIVHEELSQTFNKGESQCR